MFIELFGLLIAVSFLFLFFADYKEKKPFFTIGAGFILCYVGILLALNPLTYTIGESTSSTSYLNETNYTIVAQTMEYTTQAINTDLNLMLSLFLIILGLGAFLYGVLNVFNRKEEGG